MTLAFDLPGTVESVVRSRLNGPLIATAAALWINDGDRVLDVTYGRGGFWTQYRPADLTAHDLAIDGIDFRDLPYADATFDVVVFDPPYIAQGGRDTSSIPEFLNHYGLVDVPKTTTALGELIDSGITEATRVLQPQGRLFVKCMDYVNGGRYITAHQDVVSCAIDLGLRQVDEFIHYSGTGPQPPRPRQLTSRRAHSFLCIFQKGRA